MHVYFGVCNETAHKNIGFLDFHEISTIGPADSLFLDLVSKPMIFLLERQVSNLFWGEGDNFFVI